MIPVIYRLRAIGHSLSNKTRLFVFFVFLLIPAFSGAITLDECIHTALKLNPDLEAMTFRVEAARAAHQQARSNWYPQLALSGNYTRTNNPAQAFMMALNQERLDMTAPGFDPADPGNTHNIRVSLGVEYLLFDGGRSRAGEQITRHEIEISSYARDAAKNALVYEVVNGYYNVMKAEDLVTVFRKTTGSIEKSLRMARERLEHGTVVRTDVLNLQVQLAQAHEDLMQAENNFLFSIDMLNTAIGADIVKPGKLTRPPEQPPALSDIHIGEETVSRRPELQAAVLSMQSKKLALRQSRRGYLPHMTAFGSLDVDRYPSDEFQESYIFGVRARWDIFDGFARSGAVSEARARRNESVAMLKNIRNQLELDLKEARLRVSNAGKRLDVTRTGLESAAESLRITRERYEKGAVGITELLTAQTAFTTSEARNRVAHYEFLKALANMDRATGKSR